MTASVGELLDLVQQVAWNMAASLPDDARARARETAATTRGIRQAWPAFAASAARALRAVPLSAAAHEDQADVVGLLQRQGRQGLVGGSTPASLEPDVRVQRMGLLLGAVADLLTDQPRALDPVDVAAADAVRDRIATAVETAARFARATADVAPNAASGPGWRVGLVQVTDGLRALVTTHPAGRAGLLDDIAAVAAGEPSISGAMQRWCTAVGAVVSDPARAAAAGPSLRLASLDSALAARAAGLLLAAGGEAGVIPHAAATQAQASLTAAADAWQSAAAGWTAQMRVPGRVDPALLAAGRDLHERLAAVVLVPGRRWASPTAIAERAAAGELRETVQDARRIAVGLDGVAPVLAGCVETLVTSSAVFTPARTLTGRGNTDPALLSAISRGQWVPLPAAAEAGRDLVTAARAAAVTTHRAREAAALTAPFPVTLASRLDLARYTAMQAVLDELPNAVTRMAPAPHDEPAATGVDTNESTRRAAAPHAPAAKDWRRIGEDAPEEQVRADLERRGLLPARPQPAAAEDSPAGEPEPTTALERLLRSAGKAAGRASGDATDEGAGRSEQAKKDARRRKDDHEPPPTTRDGLHLGPRP